MKTADLIDAHGDKLRFCDLPWRAFGRRRAFDGEIATVRCFEDNVILRAMLSEPGRGRVLVVDAGGSTRCAVMGDLIAALMVENDWAGAVINGAIRDSAEIDQMPVGLRALSTSPVKSAKDGAGRRDVPVSFSGVTFRPGEWLYADEDGILTADDRLS